MTTPSTAHTGASPYRPDIDGLRAFAVLAVVFFHAFPKGLRAGFIGVDVFFVISGYLIGGIILDAIDNGRFTFRHFYARRIRRIFPALVTVLAATVIMGYVFLLPDEYEALGKHTFGGASFLSNFFLWQESGYFDAEAKTKPLLHLWSLGIEEQFYIVFPLLLWLCAKLRRSRTVLIILLLCAASFCINIGLSFSSPAAEFYSPAARVWELLIGSALCAVTRKPEILSFLPSGLRRRVMSSAPLSRVDARTLRLLLAICGIFLLALALLVAKRPSHWPGWIALLPTAGTAMLIAAGPETWINRTLLSHRFAVGLGLVSYPLYLWHWPFLSFAFLCYVNPPEYVRLSCIIIAFALAVLTYLLIERPIRFGSRARRAQMICLIAGMSAVGGGGAYVWLHGGLPSRIANLEQIHSVLNAARDYPFLGAEAQKDYKGTDYWAQASLRKQTTLFIGDSTAAQYWPRIDELITAAPDEVNSAIFMICPGCPPVPGMRYDPPKDKGGKCNDYAGKALEMAKSSPDIVNVVIAAAWVGYLKKEKERNEPTLRLLSQYIRNFVAAGKKVFFVSYVPVGWEFHSRDLIKRDITAYPNMFSVSNNSFERSLLDERHGTTRGELERISLEAGAAVIRPMDFLCGERCDAMDSRGKPIYSDGWHLSGTFVRRQATFIDAVMR